MSATRLSQALAEGLFSFPDGRVAVWGARAGTDLSDVPVGATLISTFRPDHDALRAMGRKVARDMAEDCALALVFVPREKTLARAYVAEAARKSTGRVILDGQKSDGIEGLLREVRQRHRLSPALSKAHGKLAVLEHGAELGDWADPGPAETREGLFARAGVFSADGPDPGSRLLAEALPHHLGPRVADLGAGSGFLARAILKREGVAEVHLVEAESRALDCARLAVTDPRARFHWADATRFEDAARFDTVVSNPPFHVARAADPGLGRAFIVAAARLLKPRGQLWLVANRHLPYEKTLAQTFADVSEVDGDASYKVFRGARPKTKGAIS